MLGFDVVWIIDRLWLNPESYLNLLLTVLPERFVADPKASIVDLMPLAQKMQQLFKTFISSTEH